MTTHAKQNFPDNVLYEMDNLDVLRGMNSETVDLIATDPPFNKKRNRASTSGQYEDAWRWSDHPTMAGKRPDQWLWQPVHREWLDEIKDEVPALYQVIETARATQDDDTAAFLCFISVRLLEMHRVLKPTGSIYLHCDQTANSYIRLCMDAIFGKANFRNEVIWKRTARGFKGSQFKPRTFNANTDTILFYSKSRDSFFDMEPVMEPYDPVELETRFKLQDDKGRYYMDDMHNRRSASPRPNLCYEYDGFNPPYPSGWKVGEARMIQLDRAGELVREKGKLRRKIRPKAGLLRNNLWDDINEAKGDERSGSPDQKPLALYERIIKASSQPGDLVLDRFAGCATTPIAARNLRRRWVGIDRRPDARFLIVCRLAGIKKKDADEIRKRPDLAEWLNDQLAKYEAHYATSAPERTDGQDTAAPSLEPVYASHEKSVFTHKDMHVILIERFGPLCWGCDFDGSIYEERGPRYLELDHVNPKSAGGHDHLDNRALLCGPCNREKGDSQTLVSLRRSTMGNRRARSHRIDLVSASAWCRTRLAQERDANTQV